MFSVPTSRLCSDLRIFVNLACASDRSVIRAPLSHASPVSRLPEGFLEKNDLARCVFISFFPLTVDPCALPHRRATAPDTDGRGRFHSDKTLEGNISSLESSRDLLDKNTRILPVVHFKRHLASFLRRTKVPARLWWPQINVLSFAFSSFHVPENGSARRLCLLFLNTNTRIGARRLEGSASALR